MRGHAEHPAELAAAQQTEPCTRSNGAGHDDDVASGGTRMARAALVCASRNAARRSARAWSATKENAAISASVSTSAAFTEGMIHRGARAGTRTLLAGTGSFLIRSARMGPLRNFNDSSYKHFAATRLFFPTDCSAGCETEAQRQMFCALARGLPNSDFHSSIRSATSARTCPARRARPISFFASDKRSKSS